MASLVRSLARAPLQRFRILFGLLFLLVVIPAQLRASSPLDIVVPGKHHSTSELVGTRNHGLPGPLFAESILESLFQPIRRLLTTERRMAQFGLIGVCLALYIMVRMSRK